MSGSRRGLVVVLTGDGKGKSSSAFGMVLRAVGWEMRVCVLQFIKSAKRRTGEQMAAQRLGVEWHALGDGFTWKNPDPATNLATARRAWAICREKLTSGAYDLIVWDEIHHAITQGWLTAAEVVEAIQLEKPPHTHLILTGRNAPPELVASADTVSEINAIKHAFTVGIPAAKGIEF
ncbi:MAG: cob(I)yrinic acid a,c-diamide adenosyltransferase [Magnetococcales bacterium]|nr:cob(I)yrinic acid a,c-diamide adenosyltransferase [Magnetococcales bacterium]